MNAELQLAAFQLLTTLLTRAAEVSGRIQAGTITKEYLDSLDAADAEARARQVAAQNRAITEGR